jgi:hypothetical protein
MTNEIRTVREAIDRGLASARPCPEERFSELSPCGRYRLEVEGYATADLPDHASILVAVVREVASGAVVATVRRNDTRCFHAWVSREGHDYLLLPEDLEGQTVVDLTTGRVEGFSSPEDAFIWVEFHPSTDASRLAVVGCYWACPYQVTVYDFRDPMSLPLPKLGEFVLPGSDARFGEWTGAAAFTLRAPDGTVRVVELGSDRA